jgi:hypothetical protein
MNADLQTNGPPQGRVAGFRVRYVYVLHARHELHYAFVALILDSPQQLFVQGLHGEDLSKKTE